MMELAQEEIMGCRDQALVIKGKRTKRQRPPSPLSLAMVSTSSSGGGGGGGGERFSDNEEEEDMANCLILLAQGNTKKKISSSSEQPSKVSSGCYVYQCKTCNRCFPSFQALGGHRANHKKPKAINNNGEKKTLVISEEEEDDHHHRFAHMSTTLSLQIADRAAAVASLTGNNNKSNKVHECSICRAEFSSGQALGGHMRRHRAFLSTTTPPSPTTALSMATSGSLVHHQHQHQSREAKKTGNILQLDLNLPAPEDDRGEAKFPFASKEQVRVFSTSSLVDCHY